MKALPLRLPTIYFQAEYVVTQFNLLKFFNVFHESFKINACKMRETFQHLINAKFACQIHAIQSSSSIFMPSLYLLSEDIEFIEADLSRDAQINFDKCFVCCNQGSLGNYYHWAVQTMLSIVNFEENLKIDDRVLLIPCNLKGYQKSWLDLCGINHRNFKIHEYNYIQVISSNSLFVSLTLYKPFDHQPSNAILRKFRKRALNVMSKTSPSNHIAKKLYISRADSN